MGFKIWANKRVLIKFWGRESSSKYVHDPYIHQTPKSNCFIAVYAVGEKHCSVYKYIYFGIY